MDQQTVIAEMEARADAAGVSIRQVCVKAGVHPTTFSRWKVSERNPEPIGATLQSLKKLDEALRQFEKAPVPPSEAA